MTKNEKIHFDKSYQQLLKCLKLQGKADKTIDSYSRAIRRVVQHFDCLPEALTPDNLKDYFAALVESHSWRLIVLACSFTGGIFLKKTGSGLILLNHQK